jgi:hypothetical protein
MRSQLLPILVFVATLLLSPTVFDEATTISAAQGGGKSKPPTYAVYYSPGVMERVARKRGIPVTSRMASVPDCSKIGGWVTAKVNGHVATYRIVDCSAPKDRARHIRQGLVLEVNYSSKLAFFPRGAGRVPATIIRYD